MSKLPTNKADKIKSWLSSIDANNFNDVNDQESCSSVVESSEIDTSSSSESGEELSIGECMHDSQINNCENILPPITALSFNNVNISNSTNVYLGNIYKVNGNLSINLIQSEERQQEDDTTNSDATQQNRSPVIRPACLIFPRYRWLAMDPLTESKKLLEPVEIVVIDYTATTSSTVQAKNIGIIRDYQTLNVEAQGFNDIIYNFLVGCDGVVYEGRGWDVEGEHTAGYNHKSIGVAFVGNFKHDQPTERVLKAFKNLLIRGVSEGHISKDYKLLTSCQCSSKGNLDALCEAFKKWDHFREIHKCHED